MYSPHEVAAALVQSSSTQRPDVVADFAVGEGALLRCAERRWPTAQAIGLDIERSSIEALRRTKPDWILSVGDFLNSRSRSATTALRAVVEHGSVVVLLNPPFSYRGRGGIEVASGHGTRLPPAMAFVATALAIIPPGSEVLALLPESALSSEKSAPAWRAIEDAGVVEVQAAFRRGTFESATAATRIVRMQSTEQLTITDLTAAAAPELTAVDLNVPVVRRGSVRADKVKSEIIPLLNGNGAPEGVTYVHTTHLRRGRLDSSDRLPVTSGRVFRGPCLVLPRVGRPDRAKLTLMAPGETAILSDCVVGIECRTLMQAERLQLKLIEDWISIAPRLWAGTCAPYTTLSRVRKWVIEALAEVGPR